jgi:membrane protein required for colicin V production
MEFIDIVLIGFLIYGVVCGLWNGFFMELASLVSLFVGIYIAIKFTYIIKILIGNHFHWSSKTIQITAFALTFILVVVAISFLGKFFTSLANFASLGVFNKLGGGVFGLLRMILILSVLLNLFQKVNGNYIFAKKATLERSLLFYPIKKTAEYFYPTLSEWVREIKKI